jgi:hypothetical protein
MSPMGLMAMSHGSCRKAKGLEPLEKEQKILAKIVCVPGKSTFVAAWMKMSLAAVLEADENAKIWTIDGNLSKP